MAPMQLPNSPDEDRHSNSSTPVHYPREQGGTTTETMDIRTERRRSYGMSQLRKYQARATSSLNKFLDDQKRCTNFAEKQVDRLSGQVEDLTQQMQDMQVTANKKQSRYEKNMDFVRREAQYHYANLNRSAPGRPGWNSALEQVMEFLDGLVSVYNDDNDGNDDNDNEDEDEDEVQ